MEYPHKIHWKWDIWNSKLAEIVGYDITLITPLQITPQSYRLDYNDFHHTSSGKGDSFWHQQKHACISLELQEFISILTLTFIHQHKNPLTLHPSSGNGQCSLLIFSLPKGVMFILWLVQPLNSYSNPTQFAFAKISNPKDNWQSNHHRLWNHILKQGDIVYAQPRSKLVGGWTTQLEKKNISAKLDQHFPKFWAICPLKENPWNQRAHKKNWHGIL